jgi:SEC-C motif-containing protein
VKLCPCGSALEDATCCVPLIEGERRAETPEALMRSRYTAYTRGAIDYLIATHAPERRQTVDRKEIEKWTRTTLWLGLKPFRQHERSMFRRDGDGSWLYVDGTLE